MSNRETTVHQPPLFSIFVDDFIREVNALGLGIAIEDIKISILLYADDNESDMQKLLDTVHNWCKRWRVLINTDKSKITHFRSARRRRSEVQFKVGDNILEIVTTYKYLGVIFDEKKDFKENAEHLAKGGGRGLGAVISKINTLKKYGIKTYEKLFNSCGS